jgi:acyl-CoA hydrolase
VTAIVAAADLDLGRVLRPGDRIVSGHASGEPGTLVETLTEQGPGIGGLSLFTATSFSGRFTPATAASFALSSLGAIGALRTMAQAHQLAVIPGHIGQIGPLIEAGAIGCDVAFIQVSPADETGHHSLGLAGDYVRAAVRTARVVVAEVNDQVPFTYGELLPGAEIDVAVPVSRPPVEVPAAPPGPVDEDIARHAAAYVEDGSVLQIGIGAVPEAITRLLRDRRDLGVHSGMLGDGLVDLVESGAVTNARKPIDRGVSVTGLLIGTQRLFGFAHRNDAVALRDGGYTSDPAVLARLDRLVTINSALEVDLGGQVNAEQSGPSYLGGTGGQVDFVRAGARSPGGHAIIALPATARSGTISRITARLSGPVTTARTEVDVIVTEFGAAELKGRSLAERARRLVAIAHPAFREDLEREARSIQQRGY